MSSPALRPNWLEVDLDALEHNYAELDRRAGPHRQVIAAVKADAYGHGAVEVSRALARRGCAAVWTGHVPEALAIQEAGLGLKVILFGGYTADQIPGLVAAGLVPTVYDLEGARAAAAARARIFVKVDSGLGRLGTPLGEARETIRAMAQLRGVTIEGIYTHLPFGTAEGQAWAAERAEAFGRLLQELEADGIRPAVTQLWGSCGLYADLPDPTNAVCIGHLLYGLTPFPALAPVAEGFRPAVKTLGSKLIHVARHPAGAGLAIGGAYSLRNAATVGVIPLGVGDGLRRLGHDGQPQALLRGRRVPVIGTSLEHTVLDLDGIDDPRPGEEVRLVGDDGGERIALADWAGWMGCSELDAVLGFGGRMERRYVNAEEDVWANFAQR
jgi:alanine racemase